MNSKISVSNLNLYYGQDHALKSVNMEIPENEITAFIDLQVVVNLLF